MTSDYELIERFQHATPVEAAGPRLARLQSIAIVLGVAGLALTVIGFFIEGAVGHDALRYTAHSYLLAYLFWMGATAGSLGFLMLHHVVGGGWSFTVRRLLEAATRMLPVMFVLALVLVGLVPYIYSWANADVVAHDPILRQKEFYLSWPFFGARTVLYFIIWGLYAWGLNQLGRRQDESNSPHLSWKLNMLAGSGLVVYVLTTTFAAVDWVLSLTPDWTSSIIGMLWVVAQGLTTLAVMIILVSFLGRDLPLVNTGLGKYFRDLGNLMLAFVLLWSYMSFSQFLITYSGNTVEEISFFIQRRGGEWWWISMALIFTNFLLPFVVLVMGSHIKKNPRRLAGLAGYIIFTRLLDLYWWTTPPFSRHLYVGLTDIGLPLLLGGIWLYFWAAQVKRGRSILPEHDPRLEGNWQEVVEHA